MRPAALVALVLLLPGASAAAAPAGGVPEAAELSAPAAEADPALLEGILQEENISTEIPVSLGEYLETVWRRIVAGLAGTLGRHAGWLAPASIAFLWFLAAVVILVLAWLLWIVFSILLRRRRRRAPEIELTLSEPETAAPRDLSTLYQRALEAREYRAALSLLWVQVAGRLSKAGLGHLERHLTQREFVASVRTQAPGWPPLPALVDLERRIERALYGPAPPTGEQVRQAEKVAGEILG